ncbi:MAG: serine/threonine-protein kinase [Planctomycetota bacterium]
MSELTADQLATRALECRLLDARIIDRAVSEAGGRNASYEQLESIFVRQELLTNWQITRLIEGQRRGYFYGNWKVLYLVGAGTFARVYRGCHTKTADIKAIKVLRNRYSEDEETQDSFLREGKMVMKLRHPNIVPIYEVDEDKGRIYMVMDFIEGQNLRDYVRAHKKLNVKVAMSIIRDLAAGLDYAFEQGISHRDLKLSNVLLSTKRQAKLVDFGLAAVTSDDKNVEDTFNPRSIDYAGLEKASGVVRDDKRSDIYFLGCMLYHMLSGHPPLSETKERSKRISPQRYREIIPITNHEPGLPHRVVVLCHRLMELDADKRSQTPGLALKEIDGVIEALEQGHFEKYDPTLTQQHSQDFDHLTKKENEGEGKTVLLIESNIKIQDVLRSKLKELGYRVLIIGDAQRGVRRFENLDAGDDKPADVVIFGSAGLGRMAVEAFAYFAQGETKIFPSILLLKPELKKLMASFKMNENQAVLDLPLKFKRVRAAVKKLANAQSDSASVK